MSGLLVGHQCLTSCALVAEWTHIPMVTVQNLVERLHRIVEAVVAKQQRNSILMPMLLERDVQLSSAHILFAI